MIIKHNKCCVLFTTIILLALLCGCGNHSESTTENTSSNYLISDNESYEKTDSNDVYSISSDNLSLYKDEVSVTTMYLTVGYGSEFEGTNHTWAEINSHPLSWYQADEEPYRCDAVIQVGDELGPLSGEFGYTARAANATVELKGASASEKQQKSYRIRIKDGCGKWNSQKIITLNKELSSPLRYEEKLAYDLQAGLPGQFSCQTQLVHLYVKDKSEHNNELFVDYGLYTQIEQVNKTYLKNHGLDEDGYLYKANNFDFDLHSDVLIQSTSKNYNHDAFEQILEIKGTEDHESLLEMLKDVNSSQITTKDLVKKWFNADNLYYYLAYHILIGDQSINDFYLYKSRSSDAWYIISTDMNNILQNHYSLYKDSQYQRSYKYGAFICAGNKLFTRILQDEYCAGKVSDAINMIYNDYILDDRFIEKSNTYYSVVSPYLESLPDRVFSKVTSDVQAEFKDALYPEFQENYQDFFTSFESPWPFKILSPTTDGASLTLHWTDSYVANNGSFHYSVEIDNTPLFSHPIIRNSNISSNSFTLTQPLTYGPWFVRIQAISDSGKIQDATNYYLTEKGQTIPSTVCIYQQLDGSADLLTYID